MVHIIFLNRRFYFYIIFLLISYSNLLAQSEKSALTKIEELRFKPGFKPQNSEYIDLILELAKAQVRTNSDSTSILLKEGYELSLDSKYRAGESRALAIFGYLYFEKGEIKKAYEYNMKALKVANTYNLNREKIKALNNMGLDFWMQGDDALALTQFLEALNVAKEAEDTQMIITLNINIANLYSDNGDYKTSLTFLELAKQINTGLNSQKSSFIILLNMASDYSELGNITKAERSIDESISLLEKQNSIDWLSHAYEEKGSITLMQNNYKEALKWFLKSEKLCDEINFSLGYTMVYNGLAESYLGLQNINFAEKYALKGLEISTQLNISKSIETSKLLLSKIYHEKGNDKKAYIYQNEYIEMNEKGSVEKFKKGLGILRSKMKFENQKKLLIEENNKAIVKHKNYVLLAITALFVVLLFLVLIYRTNKLQKKYTQNLQEKQEILITREVELCDSNKTKDKLFSIVAHDLKGPINSFHSLMQMYSEDTISKEDYDSLFPKALQSIQGISEMLNNLLIWAKTQMIGIELIQENIDINDLVMSTVLLLKPSAQKKEINILNTIPENTISFSDRNHLDIIIRNLISNAIKFTNIKGEITVNVIEKGNKLQLAVADNGVGMDLETQSMLFEKKHMQSTYGTNNEKGTGLGLSICKDMVESNGGKIWVSSKLNKGTTIYFTIPTKLDNEKTV